MKFGFIGVGNMGGALAGAVCMAAGAENVAISGRSLDSARSFASLHGCQALTNDALASQAEFLFLGVKPQVMSEMLSGIAPILASRTSPFVLISMAAGPSITRIRELAGGEYPVIRIMPNTPVQVGEGMTQFTCADVSEAQKKEFLAVMTASGRMDEIPESLIDAASALSGCGPAFVYVFMEALADGGVECGLPRAKAQEYAAQTLLGAAKLALESGKAPGSLKDRVCSPGGSTIAGVHALERGAFRACAMDAVTDAFVRSRELGKK